MTAEMQAELLFEKLAMGPRQLLLPKALVRFLDVGPQSPPPGEQPTTAVPSPSSTTGDPRDLAPQSTNNPNPPSPAAGCIPSAKLPLPTQPEMTALPWPYNAALPYAVAVVSAAVLSSTLPAGATSAAPKLPAPPPCNTSPKPASAPAVPAVRRQPTEPAVPPVASAATRPPRASSAAHSLTPTMTATAGSGHKKTPWVFVHGFLGTVGNFGDVLLEAARQHRVLAFDLPGFGGSASLDRVYGIKSYAAVLKEFLTATESSPAHLVCHSMGGQICLAFALAHPQAVATLTLLAPAGIYDRSAYIRGMAQRAGNVNLGHLAFDRDNMTTDATLSDDEFFRRFITDEPVILAAIESFGENLREHVREIETPALVIWGEKDPVFSVQTGFFLKENLPNASLRIVQGAGHSPQLSHPKKVTQWIKQHHARFP